MQKKIALFLGKKQTGKSPQHWGLHLQTPVKEQKEFRKINIVLLLPLISYFKLCARYPSSATGSDLSAS